MGSRVSEQTLAIACRVEFYAVEGNAHQEVARAYQLVTTKLKSPMTMAANRGDQLPVVDVIL